jgi:hypothetical protein
MRQLTAMLACLVVVGFSACECPGRNIEIEAPPPNIGKYEKLELLIQTDSSYGNPFDPEEVDLTVLVRCPSGRKIVLPAFFCQDYERRKLNLGRNRANWFYPEGVGTWKARFAPMETGTHLLTARLKDRTGTVRSQSVRFNCIASSSKGFLRVSPEDPRFLSFTEGKPFFVIGQNMAFVGETQYVNLTKAEQVFGKLSENGANFVRAWTCCEDWAMAIEARKSAWDRSWHRSAPIVPMPGAENGSNPHSCVKIAGDEGASINVSPSHPVALRPRKRYVLTGRFRKRGNAALGVEMTHGVDVSTFEAAAENQWTDFKCRFVTGESDFWLGRLALHKAGSGTIWIDKLSLKEAGGGAELLWEADVNRPARGFYNQLDCFMLDELVEAAERNGIYLMLCLITRDLYMKSLSDPASAEYERAVKDARNLLRYAVARWGHSTNVAAWEYFNEIDPGLPTDRFYDEIGEYLEKTDPYKHLRTTSTWHPSAKDCRHRRLDIGQSHHYMRPETKEDYRDEVAVLTDKTRFLRENAPAKPVLIGEFGLANPKWGLSADMKRDSEGVHFHNSLWASAFAGSSGTAMFWWWDQLDRQDAYRHYGPLSTFLAGVSFAGLQPIDATASDVQLRAIGYQGSDRAYMWLSDKKAIWWNLVVDKQKPAEIKGATVGIRGLGPGTYNVQWWHTLEGKTLHKERVVLADGSLRISVPSFSRDVACKIKRR